MRHNSRPLKLTARTTALRAHRQSPSGTSGLRPDFIGAAKVPQVVTHDKVLVNCEAEFDEFVDRMDLLKVKLRPLLLQFHGSTNMRSPPMSSPAACAFS